MAETTPNNVAASAAMDQEANKPNAPGQKQETKKVIRLLTVVAYMTSVSMAAFMLSAYYIFLWSPKEHRVGPLRLVDPCPDCYVTTIDNSSASAVDGGALSNRQLNTMLQNSPYNDTDTAETPRALPAKELTAVTTAAATANSTATTPLSRLAQDYIDMQQQGENYSLSGNS